MKRSIFVYLLVAAGVICSLSSCATTVERVKADDVVDLDGFWNDSDVRMVCESLISDCIKSPRVAQYEKKNGRAPVAIVGKISNDSDEHIDTSIVAKKFQNAIINSGVMDFVSDKNEREELREERLDQQDNASEDTAKAIGNETGADFMLLGSIKTIVQTEGRKSVRAYFVYAELHDLETNKIIWSGEDDEIKKVINRPAAKM
ncbi:MAG: penicillin-binding protein activator LpoB [Treponema sp.]|nr:penicillin-binding protein activator LpoB [Treponema sp.]